MNSKQLQNQIYLQFFFKKNFSYIQKIILKHIPLLINRTQKQNEQQQLNLQKKINK